MNYSPQFSTNLLFLRLTRLEEIKKLDPIDFEHFTAHLFERMGYEVETTPETGDGGIDLFIQKDGRRAVVQCKRYENLVGQPVVRDLYGAMLHHRVDHAYIITTGQFSLPAQTWAAGKFINLVDGNQLCEWLGYVQPPPLIVEKPPPIPIHRDNKKTWLWVAVAMFFLLIGLLGR